MRLLNINSYTFREFHGANIPPYIIASHRWTDDEATFKDVLKARNRTSKGWNKIEGFCERARQDNKLLESFENATCCEWIWIDTACIDKRSSAEVSESINSMFQWYGSAQECHAYMADVKPFPASEQPAEVLDDFKHSEWFKRGWTLQELLAPRCVVFFTQTWQVIGHKCADCSTTQSCEGAGPLLNAIIAEVTGIPEEVLRDCERGKYLPVEQKMRWQVGRRTTRIEDRAYCLLGLFDVHMPLLYGEGEKAMLRLERTVFEELERPWRSQLRLNFNDATGIFGDGNCGNSKGYVRKGRPLAIMRYSNVEGEVSCICGYGDDDGYLIACDICQYWQHVLCYFPGIEQAELSTDQEHACVKCLPRVLDVAAARTRQEQKRADDAARTAKRNSAHAKRKARHDDEDEDDSDIIQPPRTKRHQVNGQQEAEFDKVEARTDPAESEGPVSRTAEIAASPPHDRPGAMVQAFSGALVQDPIILHSAASSPVSEAEKDDAASSAHPAEVDDKPFGVLPQEQIGAPTHANLIIDHSDSEAEEVLYPYAALDFGVVHPADFYSHELAGAPISSPFLQSGPIYADQSASFMPSQQPQFWHDSPSAPTQNYAALDSWDFEPFLSQQVVGPLGSPPPRDSTAWRSNNQDPTARQSQITIAGPPSRSETVRNEPNSSSSGYRQHYPMPDCGDFFEDLHADMLNHRVDRPEKCPVPTCEYHTKGFARKYDQNRHVLTHYKGEMICEFCSSGPGSAVRTFSRADILKRHLTSVHGVEQMPGHRRIGPSAGSSKRVTGTTVGAAQCSLCSEMHANPQEFYDHLDDCVQRMVKQQLGEAESYTCAFPECAAAGVDFAKGEDLQRHSLTVHGRETVERFPCTAPECGRSFTRKSNLVNHQRAAHGMGIMRRS